MTKEPSAGRQMPRFLDPAHPFFRPLWVRLAVIGVALAWGLFEFSLANPFWGIVFLGLGFYSAWSFFIAGPQRTARQARSMADGDTP